MIHFFINCPPPCFKLTSGCPVIKGMKMSATKCFFLSRGNQQICFYSHYCQHQCKFIGTKDRVYIRKEFHSHRIRVFIRHQRSENSQLITQNSPVNVRQPMTIFYSDVEPLSKYSSVTLHLSPDITKDSMCLYSPTAHILKPSCHF